MSHGRHAYFISINKLNYGYLAALKFICVKVHINK